MESKIYELKHAVIVRNYLSNTVSSLSCIVIKSGESCPVLSIFIIFHCSQVEC